MTDIITELRLSRAFVDSFFDAVADGKVDVPQEVMEKFKILHTYYLHQLNKELS